MWGDDNRLLSARPMSALGQKPTYALQQTMSALPLIATAKADCRKSSCPLYPQKRSCAAQQPMSALGQKRTSTGLCHHIGTRPSTSTSPRSSWYLLWFWQTSCRFRPTRVFMAVPLAFLVAGSVIYFPICGNRSNCEQRKGANRYCDLSHRCSYSVRAGCRPKAKSGPWVED